MDHRDGRWCARDQLVGHQTADRGNHKNIENGSGADRLEKIGQARLATLDVDVRIIGDQAGWTVDLGHHVITGIDAQAALDTAQIRAVADIHTGRADSDTLLAIDTITDRVACGAQGCRLFDRHALLAAVITIGHIERVLIGQCGLNTRPRAGIETNLLAHQTGKGIGGEGEHENRDIGGSRALEGQQLHDQSRRIVEIQHPCAAGPPGDQQPECVLEQLEGEDFDRKGAGIALHPFAPVSLDQPFDRHEQIGPDRLRAEIAAPDPACQRVHQEQRHGCQDQQACQIIDLLRPDFDEEEIGPPVRHVDQHRLVGRMGTAIPADEGQHVIDTECNSQNDPLDPAIGPRHRLRIDLLARFVKRQIGLVAVGVEGGGSGNRHKTLHRHGTTPCSISKVK